MNPCLRICIFLIAIDMVNTTMKPQIKIVGGDITSIEKFPYQVSISRTRVKEGRITKNFICGGSIISPTFVLTAAHCTKSDFNATHYTVRAGSNYTFTQGTLHRVIKIISHHKYLQLDNIIINDICLLKVSPRFIFNAACRPVKLAIFKYKDQSDMPIQNELATVSGFGRPAEQDKPTHRLMTTDIPFLNWTYCYHFYKRRNISFSVDFICAGYDDNSKNTCQGDSGGPMVYRGWQVGIVSWGIGCTEKGYPGAYTRVAYFSAWIRQNVDDLNKMTSGSVGNIESSHRVNHNYPSRNVPPGHFNRGINGRKATSSGYTENNFLYRYTH